MTIIQAYAPAVICRLPLFVALCDHNLPTLQIHRQTDRLTDGRHHGWK